MSNLGQLFNIPNSKRGNPKLPKLKIPTPESNLSSNSPSPKVGSNSSGPKRKPPPIDFLLVDCKSPVSEIIEGMNEKMHVNTLPFHHSDLESIEDKDLEELCANEWNELAKNKKIIEISKLGEGNGGSVSKCKLEKGSKVFALKLISVDPNPDIHKQILRELQYNRSCHSPNIVKYYGTFMIEEQLMIGIAMEYMGGRSLDAIYKRIIEIDPTNRINEKVLGKVAVSVLKGLNYLHQQKIIHRDIKPSNILLDSDGNIKLCDFGVSGEVVNSLATTFVGTQYYMAPERIMGKPYTVSSDIWSLGLTLLEVATCKFPFSSESDMILGPIELLSLILEYEPILNDEPEQGIIWSEPFKNFISYCLKKNSEERPSPRQMLNHPWVVSQLKINLRMDKFVRKVWSE
ncbi:uncharacterized protein PRCAT00004144001 [Priceomyces carsonii]|uniref:uncharacterized protein n=1 Tax=Priceomyces carsonii TaxID=28549 RepID=UPI002ED99B14|nr:unnamed protein product [Priceomyces carsonii]